MSGNNGDRDDNYNPSSPPPSPTPRKPGAGDGSGGPDGDDPCDFTDTAPLNSVQPAVVAKLTEGAILDINLNKSGPNPVLEVLFQGERAGALTHRNHVRIIRCIEENRKYRAVVIGKRGGSIELRIEPA